MSFRKGVGRKSGVTAARKLRRGNGRSARIATRKEREPVNNDIPGGHLRKTLRVEREKKLKRHRVQKKKNKKREATNLPAIRHHENATVLIAEKKGTCQKKGEPEKKINGGWHGILTMKKSKGWTPLWGGGGVRGGGARKKCAKGWLGKEHRNTEWPPSSS